MSLTRGRRRLRDSRAGAAFLSAADPRIALLVRKVGAPALFYEPERSVFEALATAILYQQLHGKAAAAILARLLSLFPPPFPEPAALLRADPRDLAACGLSRAKASAMRDLALNVLDRTLPDRD